jgi:hypothetical protein
MRVQEMIIGSRGDVVIKIVGTDLEELNRIGRDIAAAIRDVQGSSDVFALRNGGMAYLTVEVDRLAAGRLGLNASDVQDALRVWVDGRNVGVVLEGDRRIPVLLRGEEGLRGSAVGLSRVQIALPGGGTVLLSQVADIREEDGPVQVIREQAERFATVITNVRGRDIGGFVAEAQAAVQRSVQLPPGYRLIWGGQFENQQRAMATLSVVVPIALAAIFLLLFMTFGSVRQATLVFCNVPFALIGGMIALWASGEFVSVPASVGFLTLIGIAVLNGVVLISYINRLVAEEGLNLHDAVREGARRRMTPVTLTASIAALALVPFLFATGPGSEIQKPLAIVVIGGLVTATVLTLVLLPILYERFALPKAEAGPDPRNPARPGGVTQMKILMLGAALLLPLTACHAQNAAPRPRAPAAAAQNGGLARHLEAALALDATYRSLEAQRTAAGARASPRSPSSRGRPPSAAPSARTRATRASSARWRWISPPPCGCPASAARCAARCRARSPSSASASSCGSSKSRDCSARPGGMRPRRVAACSSRANASPPRARSRAT